MVRGNDKIKTVLSRLRKLPEIHSILLFGSRTRGEETPRSDFDICVVAPHVKEKDKLANLIAGMAPEGFDIVLFEVLPLYMKIEVIENHKILYSKDPLDLNEYFYFYRKLWEDQKHRQTLNRNDIQEIIKNLKKKARKANQ